PARLIRFEQMSLQRAQHLVALNCLMTRQRVSPGALQRAHELVNRHRDEMGWPASCANASRPSVRLATRLLNMTLLIASLPPGIASGAPHPGGPSPGHTPAKRSWIGSAACC